MNIKKISVIVCICCFLSNNFSFAGIPFSCCKPQSDQAEAKLTAETTHNSEKFKVTQCDTQKFDKFKQLLGRDPEKTRDFFVITVTRTGEKPLLETEMRLLPLLLKQLFSGKEDDAKYRKEVDNVVQQHKEELEERIKGYNKRDPLTGVLWTTDDLKERIIAIFEEISSWIEQVNNSFDKNTTENHPTCDTKKGVCVEWSDNSFTQTLKDAYGLVAFSECFFSGTTPLDHKEAEQYSKSLSNINTHYLFACNFLTKITNPDHLPTLEAIKGNIDIFNREIDKNKELETLLAEGKNQEASKKLEKILATTGIKEYLKETVNKTCCMENKTFYAVNSEIVSTYNKSTYYYENDDFLQKEKAFYKFGDCQDHTKDDKMKGNVSTEICNDLGLRKDNLELVNIHLLQSNTISLIPGSLPKAWCHIHCDATIGNRPLKEREQNYVFVSGEKKTPICSLSIDVIRKITVDIYQIKQN